MRDLDVKRSIINYVYIMYGGPIYWKSIVQYLVAQSIESNYMAINEAAKESLWLTELVKELGI